MAISELRIKLLAQMTLRMHHILRAMQRPRAGAQQVHISHCVPDRDKLTLQLVAGCAMMLLRRTHSRNVHEATAAVPLRSLDLRTDFQDVADREQPKKHIHQVRRS